jgi:hypothetical protein
MVQRQTRLGAPLGEETNQMSVWPHPKGSLVPLSINGRVSLVTHVSAGIISWKLEA